MAGICICLGVKCLGLLFLHSPALFEEVLCFGVFVCLLVFFFLLVSCVCLPVLLLCFRIST